jgi:hypothetical protein
MTAQPSAAPEPAPAVRLVREPLGPLHGHGTVTWQVHVGGRWVGWVGDARDWTGYGFAGRYWWACWRQDGDTAARDNRYHVSTRRAALAWLIIQATASDREETANLR